MNAIKPTALNKPDAPGVGLNPSVRSEASHPPERSLDPADWAGLRSLGHRMLDDTLDHLEGVRGRPVWQPLPAEVAGRFDERLPQTGVGLEAAYAAFERDVRPYPSGNIHPRFWGWVIGNGTPSGMLADLLASGLNPNTGGFRQAPVLVEQQALAWCAEMLGFAPDTSGLFVSGASMANLLALTVARDAHFRRLNLDVREDGVMDGALHPVYTSTEAHSCNQRAVELLGLGNRQLRRVAVDSEYRLDVTALRSRLKEDLERGERPLALIGTAGTVNTGAIDPLDALAGSTTGQRGVRPKQRSGVGVPETGAVPRWSRDDPSGPQPSLECVPPSVHPPVLGENGEAERSCRRQPSGRTAVASVARRSRHAGSDGSGPEARFAGWH